VVGRQNADIVDTLQLKDVAMATTFWLLMGYNFNCMIDSDTLFDSRGWVFGDKLSNEDSEDRGSKGRCHGNQFWDYISCKWTLTGDNDMSSNGENTLDNVFKILSKILPQYVFKMVF